MRLLKELQILGTEMYRGILRIDEFSSLVGTKAQVEEQACVYILTSFQEWKLA